MIRLSLIPLLLVSALSIADAEIPDGTWKWSTTMRNRTINSTLYLESDGEKVTGRYENENIQEPVENGSLMGDELNLEINLTFNGREVTMQFRGSVVESGIDGIAKFVVDGEQRGQDRPWKPTRYVGDDEVLGTWDFKYVAPDGVEYTPRLNVKKDGDKLAGNMTFSTGPVDVESISVKDNALVFSLTTPYRGSEIDLTYTCQPRGNKLTGSLDYEFNGNAGELDGIQATRKRLPSELKELLGEWEFSVTGDDGIERHPVLTLEDSEGELVASMLSEGETFELKDLNFADGAITFSFTRDHDGLNVDINWTCRPSGDGMTGTLEYDAGGNTGEIAVTGKRKS